jgi:hypothetical protein
MDVETNLATKRSSKKAETAKWTSSDEATLIATLMTEKVRTNWADNNPKPTTFAACVKALKGSEETSGGAPKGIAVIKARWQKVCGPFYVPDSVLTIIQLKTEFKEVATLREKSGFGWDDDLKLVMATKDVWDALIQVRAYESQPSNSLKSVWRSDQTCIEQVEKEIVSTL